MDRKGVVLVLFDLPMTKKEQQRVYRKFKKHLIQNGYRRIQESVYVKLLRTTSNTQREIAKIKLASPIEGDIQILPLPLAYFKKMIAISGTPFDMDFFSDDVICL